MMIKYLIYGFILFLISILILEITAHKKEDEEDDLGYLEQLEDENYSNKI